MLRELETFLAIVRYGTFSAAGSQIGLTQSAVSAQVKRLEEDLQTPLFERTGRTARLNEAGRSLVAKAEQLVETYRSMRASMQADPPSATIRIGAIPTAQTALLPQALADYRLRRPGCRVQIRPGTSAQVLDLLDSGALDAAIVIRPPFGIPRSYHWEPLLSEPYVAIAPLDVRGRVLAQIFADHPFIRYDRVSFGGRPVQHYLERRRLVVNDFVELKELEAIVSMVERGLGVSIVPRARGLRLPERRVRLLRLEESFHREIGLVAPGQASERPAVAGFMACLKAAARARGGRGRTAP